LHWMLWFSEFCELLLALFFNSLNKALVMAVSFSFSLITPESYVIISCTKVKARNTSSIALIFTFLAWSDLPEIWLASWCVCFPEEFIFPYGCCWYCWSELRRTAVNDRSSVVYFENILPADSSVVTQRFLLHCISCFAWLQPL
jgi:hypothetical protein